MPLYSAAVDGHEDDGLWGSEQDDSGHALLDQLRQTGEAAEPVHEDALRRLLSSLDDIVSGASPAEGSLVESFLRCSNEWSEIFELWSTYHSRRGSAAWR